MFERFTPIWDKIADSFQENGLKVTRQKIGTAARANLRVALHLAAQRVQIAVEARRVPNGMIIREVQGSMMMLDVSDVGIGRELALTGVHEPASTLRIQRELSPGMHVVEVGANIGYYLLIEGRLLGEMGRITAFEPSPRNLVQLRVNVALNGLGKNCDVVACGVADTRGTLDFFVMNKGNMSSFVHRAEDRVIRRLETLKIPVVTLDEKFGSEETVDYLRMDVEGFEEEVIDGAKGILSSARGPKGMFIEVHSRLLGEKGSSARSFFEKIDGFDYEVACGYWRGRPDIMVSSTTEMLGHELLEKGYWETFFRKRES